MSCGGLEKEMELLVKEELCEKVVEVRRVSDRVLTVVVVVFEEDELRLICGHERIVEEKQTFYGELKGVCDMRSVGDFVMYLGDFNGHVWRHIDGFDGIHGRYGVGHKNLEGRMLWSCIWKKNYASKIHGL